MARRKLEKVPAYLKSQTRSAGLTSIDANLDLGNGLTLPAYLDEIEDYKRLLKDYNTALSTVDDLYNQSIAQLDVLKDWNERMLTGVATKWGKKSSQYEMAGGVRKSERKKRTPKANKNA